MLAFRDALDQCILKQLYKNKLDIEIDLQFIGNLDIIYKNTPRSKDTYYSASTLYFVSIGHHYFLKYTAKSSQNSMNFLFVYSIGTCKRTIILNSSILYL